MLSILDAMDRLGVDSPVWSAKTLEYTSRSEGDSKIP
jgi:hypothetical protein